MDAHECEPARRYRPPTSVRPSSSSSEPLGHRQHSNASSMAAAALVLAAAVGWGHLGRRRRRLGACSRWPSWHFWRRHRNSAAVINWCWWPTPAPSVATRLSLLAETNAAGGRLATCDWTDQAEQHEQLEGQLDRPGAEWLQESSVALVHLSNVGLDAERDDDADKADAVVGVVRVELVVVTVVWVADDRKLDDDDGDDDKEDDDDADGAARRQGASADDSGEQTAAVSGQP
jgi:hypothetical protein